MYSHIVVPLDGSPFSESAIPHATALADKFNCKITLITVFQTPYVYEAVVNRDDGVLNDIHQAAIRGACDYLEAVKSHLVAQGLSVDYECVEGDNIPALILDAVQKASADLVVMSTHGRTGLDRWRFGSVAQRVARHSAVPVVLIHPSTEKE